MIKSINFISGIEIFHFGHDKKSPGFGIFWKRDQGLKISKNSER